MPTWLNATILPGVDIFVQNRSSPRIWNGQFYRNWPYDVAVDRASIPVVFSSSSSSSSSLSNHIFLNVTFATNGTVYLEDGANVSLANLIVSDGLVASNNNRSSSSNNNNNYNYNNNNNSTSSHQHPSLTSLNYTYLAISANIRHAVVLRNLDILVGHAAKITDSVVLAGGTNLIIASNASLEGFSDSDYRQPVGTSTGVISNYGKAKFQTYSYSPAVYSIINSGLDAELDVTDQLSASFFSAPIVFEDGAALILGRSLGCSDQGSLTFLDGGRLISTGNYPSLTNCKIAMQSGSTFSSGYGVVSLQSSNLTLQTGSTLWLGASSPRLNQIFAVNQNTPSFVTIEPNVSLVINTTAPPLMGTNFTVFTTQANMSTTFSLSIVSLIFPTLVYKPYYNSTTGIYKIQLVSLGDVRPPLDLHVTSAGPSQKVSLAWVDELCPQNTTYVRDTVEVTDQQHQPYVSYTTVPAFTTKAYYRGGSTLMIRVKTTCGLVSGTNYIYNAQDSEWTALNLTVPTA